MKIISHRGWWKSVGEKNSPEAFQRSLAAGYGFETDVRDCLGELVVAHDPAQIGAMCWNTLLDLFERTDLTLAVNVKADGLDSLIRNSFEGRKISWFAFDMSGPEMVRYIAAGLPTYTRHSDMEVEPILYSSATGVWLDAFQHDWITREVVARHLDAGKSVCVVSPELHGREYRGVWERLSGIIGDVTLCTDHLEEAAAAFIS